MRVKIVEREVLDPLADSNVEKLELIPIPKDIKRISLFDNTKPNADVILGTIEKNLNNITFSCVKKPAGAPATDEQINKVAKADLSILALGDCGSCTTWVILDAIRLEKQGNPTISICSHRFAPFAHELARSHGMENLRIIEIEHPIAGQSRAEVRKKTLKIMEAVKALLRFEE